MKTITTKIQYDDNQLDVIDKVSSLLKDFNLTIKYVDPDAPKDGYEEIYITRIMTEREMFEKSFERPKYYFKLSEDAQWDIDKALGILDWIGKDLTEDDKQRFNAHYEK